MEYHTGSLFTYGSVAVQVDFDYPWLAQRMGWSLARVQKRSGKLVHLSRVTKKGCLRSSTDGTVACWECGVTASEFISAAGEYLHERAQ